jgi:tetraacyldisaccharide 4'-kinase
MTAVDLRAKVASYLEGDLPPARITGVKGALASAWAAIESTRVSRPLRLPLNAAVIGIGGSTLGGSYKTPLAVALAEALAKAGERVAVVGHGYRAHARWARAVEPSDHVFEVGDDALFAARRLAREAGAREAAVFIGPSRQSAIDCAARSASFLIVDGLLQARPERLRCSILALDARKPWGHGHCPPLGDLRAPPEALLHAADATATVFDAGDDLEPGVADASPALRRTGPIHWYVRARLTCALDPSGRRISLAELASARLGVLLTIARPERVLDALACRGLFAVRFHRFGDHTRPPADELDRLLRRPGPRVDVWITTEKCAVNLPPTIGRAPVLALHHELEVSPAMLRHLLGGGSSTARRP